jgi:1-acyl-sn-glycerol-3-phosphate acyltransferase
MRLPLVLLAFLIFTSYYGTLVVLAALCGVKDRPGGVYDRAARNWASRILAAAGVDVTVHGGERIALTPRVYVSNHVSWFDVFALASVLPRFKFVAKVELGRIPIFGAGARAVGTIFIDRDNRKAAFASYQVAGQRIREGSPVVVYPEGTRGRDYGLRPFKKGPIVLAISSGAPIIPVIVHGTIAVQARDSWAIRPGHVHLHFLEPITTTGLTYEDRDRLARQVEARMAAAMQELYGVDSPALAGACHAAA